MYEIAVKLDGIVPFMMHRFAVKDPNKKPSNKDKETQTLQTMCHMDEVGLFVPALNLRMLMIGTSKRKGAASIYGNEIEKRKGPMFVSLCEAYLWPRGNEKADRVYFQPNRPTWDAVDERSYITSTGGRDVTRRPIICPPWSLSFTISVVDESLKAEILRKMYDLAGLRVGIGAFGPEFGRFVVSEWKII